MDGFLSSYLYAGLDQALANGSCPKEHSEWHQGIATGDASQIKQLQAFHTKINISVSVRGGR